MKIENKVSAYIRDASVFVFLSGLWILINNFRNPEAIPVFYLVASGVALLLILFFSIVKPQIKLPEKKGVSQTFFTIASGVLVSLLILLFYNVPQIFYATGEFRLFLLVLLAAIIGFFSLFCDSFTRPQFVMIGAVLFGAILYRAFAFVPEISNSPFSLGWSEGSRIFNASLFFSEKLYGRQMPLPVLHPSRYILQSIPFLFNIRSIFIHRLWQVLLWLGMTGWASYLVAKRVSAKLKLPTILLVAFSFLFFFQGAVYYHLSVCVILVLLGYNKEKPYKTLFFVVLASLWAGISRINWIPVPALMAVALYLIETPINPRKWLDYLKMPIIWVVAGFLSGFASKQLYQALSGENPAYFDSAFSSNLLWNRLLPNNTFLLGILPAIGLVCIPLVLAVIFYLMKNKTAKLHWLRWLGLIAILAVFLGGGILVSIKIGGGGDLHNMDAFLVFFLLISLEILGGSLASDETGQAFTPLKFNESPALLLMLICFVPSMFAFMRSGSWNFKADPVKAINLEQIHEAMDILEDEPGDILFITEKQLLTMGEIEGVEMDPDYEKVFLMEMAMANNQDYLNRFYELLDEHHWKAIVMEQVKTDIQREWSGFPDENNAYVQNAILPILMDYQVVLSWDNGEINLLLPNHSDDILIRQLQKITPPK